VANCSA
jgi:murein tripeptide amidase MpaA